MLPYLVLCAGLMGFAQDVEVVPRWKQGDVIRLEYSRTKEDSRRPQNNGTSKTPVEVEILSVDAKGSTVRWRNGPTEFPAGMSIPENILKLQDKVMSMAVEIQLNPAGEFQFVINEKQVSEQMSTLLDAVLKDMGNDQNLQAMVKQLLNPAALLAAASNDAKTYFGMYGVALKPKEKVTANLEQPFPLNPGTTLPAVFEVELLGVEGKVAKLRSSTRFDEVGVATAMADLFAKAGVKPEEAGKMPKVELKDEGHFEYELETGLMRVVVAERRTEMPGALTRRDRKEFRLR